MRIKLGAEQGTIGSGLDKRGTKPLGFENRTRRPCQGQGTTSKHVFRHANKRWEEVAKKGNTRIFFYRE